MLYALNPTVIVRAIAALTLLFSIATLWRDSPDAAAGLWNAKGLVLAGPSLVIFLLTLRPVFRWVHRLSFARHWMFPWLDGAWEGEIHSNWPRIRATLDAARDVGRAFDPLSDEHDPEAQVPVAISADIRSGLFDYAITIRISGSRESHTIFVKPVWCKPAAPRLYYVYEQSEYGPVDASDSRQHRGAAILDFDSQSGNLRGEYWTQRQASLGLNTAGTIVLRRTKRPPTAN